MSRNFTKQIRKPMPSPTSAHKGVKDATRTKVSDLLDEWEGWGEHEGESANAGWDDSDLDEDGLTPEIVARFSGGRSWKA
jgi:hypothetical protein